MTGVSGPNAARITSVLEDAARDMTTLHVSRSDLRQRGRRVPAGQGHPDRDALPAPPGHHVTEHNPVAVIVADGKRVPVSGDGQVPALGPAPGDVATVQMSSVPGGDRLTDPRAGAPSRCWPRRRRRCASGCRTRWTGEHGLTRPAEQRPAPVLRHGRAPRGQVGGRRAGPRAIRRRRAPSTSTSASPSAPRPADWRRRARTQPSTGG